MTAWSTGDYASAWLNHGTQPNEATYEFVVLPGTNATHMQTFAQTQTDNPDGLYRIHQQNGDAHIIEHTTGITGYALFPADTATPEDSGAIAQSSAPIIAMAQQTENDALVVHVVNPDRGDYRIPANEPCDLHQQCRRFHSW